MTRHLPQCAAHRLRPQGREWGNKTGQGRGNSTGTKLAMCLQEYAQLLQLAQAATAWGWSSGQREKDQQGQARREKPDVGPRLLVDVSWGRAGLGRGVHHVVSVMTGLGGVLGRRRQKAPADEVAPLSSNRAERSEQWG